MIVVGLLVAFFQFVAMLSPAPVRAQEATAVPTTSPQVEVAKTSYLELLDTYRTREAQFFIAREQYKQVQTLASLEVVTNASRDVQLARVDTLTAYFRTVRETVLALKGAELTKKNVIAAQLQAIIAELGVVRVQIENAKDYLGLDKLSAQYEERNPAYLSMAYSALALIRVADIQAATDQLGVLTQQTFNTIQQASPSATVLAEKQRGYDELARTITDIKNVLQSVSVRMETYSEQNSFTPSSYAQVVDLLGQGFSKLKLAESFLKELAQ